MPQLAVAPHNTAVHGADEKLIWKGTSSQKVNLLLYIGCALIFPFSIPFIIYGYYQVKLRTYEITTQRIRIRQGVFSRRTDELELYRVLDSTFIEPFFLRIFGLGSVELKSIDRTNPVQLIEGVANGEQLRLALRECIEARRMGRTAMVEMLA
jgi:uncharacterized membrane protein YdbT with pleckstrin-like domain